MGEEPVRLALREGRARAVFLAEDAGGHTRRKVEPKLGTAPLWIVPASKAELGRALGRTCCALCAVTDKGFAESLARHFEQRPNTNHDGGVTI